MHENILMLDSGLGGLSVFRAVRQARPQYDYIYVADDAAFPYGPLAEDVLIARVSRLMARLVAKFSPDLVVIPCSTASTIVLPELRGQFSVPFVGIVPAVKPACAASMTRRVSVLATDGTVAREYTRDLVRDFAGDCKVTLVGSKHLAAYAEAELAGEPVTDRQILDEISPCFVDDGRRTDTVVLGCTHYPLLFERLVALSPWPVTFVDPAPAIARRVTDLLGPPEQLERRGTALAAFTSGRVPDAVLRRFGLRADERAAEWLKESDRDLKIAAIAV
jgi:glutamate racemase